MFQYCKSILPKGRAMFRVGVSGNFVIGAILHGDFCMLRSVQSIHPKLASIFRSNMLYFHLVDASQNDRMASWCKVAPMIGARSPIHCPLLLKHKRSNSFVEKR